ncbi:hypothetical protein M3686_03710 [Micrococcus luteus]|uniref:hypothetical protein n=1 Tax=Micrococcus luteus TaxID=1270 RepID=UPI00203C4200|nr:hypothetical protein [Micrococcus luteus]MCM3577248.1 hypothetical protein [Micrococcus luteus]
MYSTNVIPSSSNSAAGSASSPAGDDADEPVAEADPAAEGAADVGATEDATAVDAFAVEETLPWEAEHPEMAIPRRAAATTAAGNAARFFSMSLRMI